MATIKHGQVGYFNGKIGEVVITKWRDVEVGRSTPRKSSKKSLKQMDQRSRFALVTKFLASIAPAIKVGYQHYTGNITGTNAATTKLLGEAISGEYPDYTLDYSKVVISFPKPEFRIEGGFSPNAVLSADARYEVTWSENQVRGQGTQDSDLISILCYNATQGRYIYYPGVTQRSELTASISIPMSYMDDELHGYMFFVSEDGMKVSFSEYLGELAAE